MVNFAAYALKNQRTISRNVWSVSVWPSFFAFSSNRSSIGYRFFLRSEPSGAALDFLRSSSTYQVKIHNASAKQVIDRFPKPLRGRNALQITRKSWTPTYDFPGSEYWDTALPKNCTWKFKNSFWTETWNSRGLYLLGYLNFLGVSNRISHQFTILKSWPDKKVLKCAK